ncbi:hypothetical protein D3C81_10960 [compost metagenome]
MLMNLQAVKSQLLNAENNGINFDKEKVKLLNLRRDCLTKARKFLGEDMDYHILNYCIKDINDDTVDFYDVMPLREYIKNTLGKGYFLSIVDLEGDLRFDIEHGLLLYFKALKEKHKNVNKALGLLYVFAAIGIGNELKVLKKTTVKGKLYPKYGNLGVLFRWEKCPYVTRKYMMHMDNNEGYKLYYLEPSNLHQIAFLICTGMSFEEAKAFINNRTEGIFCEYLPLDIENKLTEMVLTDGLAAIQGIFSTKLQELEIEMKALPSYNKDKSNIYDTLMRTHTMNILGIFVNNLVSEIEGNSALVPSDIIINHITPSRVGIKIKDYLTIEDVLPTMHKYFKPLEELTVDNLVFGDLL